MNRQSILTAMLAFVIAGCAGGQATAQSRGAVETAIQAAIASDERTAEMIERDPARKPAEILSLSGIGPGDRVIEIAGFGQYYTIMLSALVGPSGKVDVFDLPYTEAFGGEAAHAFAASHPNMEYHLGNYNDTRFPDGVDAVFNILYYHDLGPQEIDTVAMNKKLFDSLKPGGVYLIVDHKAEAGSGWRDAGTIHRIGVETIVQEVTAAGFVLETESDLLANPDDDRTAMVFAPGTRGATDRAVFVFRKPG
jgi:predicted methyltransferase